MKKTQEEMTQSVVRKVKRSQPAEFKRKGNKKQFRFNDEVVEKLEQVEDDSSNPLAEDLLLLRWKWLQQLREPKRA